VAWLASGFVAPTLVTAIYCHRFLLVYSTYVEMDLMFNVPTITE
jgi:hypothetical protein